MTEETIPPLKTAIAIDGRPMEGKQDASDTTKDKLLRKVKEEKEQEITGEEGSNEQKNTIKHKSERDKKREKKEEKEQEITGEEGSNEQKNTIKHKSERDKKREKKDEEGEEG